MKRSALVLIALAILSPGLGYAQLDDEDYRAWRAHAALGYAVPQGILDELFTGGLSITGGATYRPPILPVIAAWVEGNYNGFDVRQQVLEGLGVGNGDLRMWSVTGGLALEARSKVGFQWTLGLGWYARQVDLVNPAPGEVIIVCNPWWYFCVPEVGVISQNIVGQRSFSSVGYNTGLALTFRLKRGSAIYLEVKYHYIPNDVEPVELIPVIAGYRW